MSGPTNRRFVRSAWTLLAFQFVAALGAIALAVWAATRVQALIDQRDLLQARVARLESEQSRVRATPAEDISVPELVPAAPLPVTIAPGPAQIPRPRPPQAAGGSGVTVHEGETPAAVIETPPTRPPETTHLPPQPPVRLPPRVPPVVRPTFPTRPVPTPQQPGTSLRPARPSTGTTSPQKPVTTTRPNRPAGVTIVRPTVAQPQAGATATRPLDPRRIRRPIPTDSGTQRNPPK